MPELPDHVRGSLATARLAIANAEKKPRRKRAEYVPEDDAFTRSDVLEAREMQ